MHGFFICSLGFSTAMTFHGQEWFPGHPTEKEQRLGFVPFYFILQPDIGWPVEISNLAREWSVGICGVRPDTTTLERPWYWVADIEGIDKNEY